MTLTIYNYHPTTGEYVGAAEADKSPLEVGTYLIPAFATKDAPPEAQHGFARIFTNGAWELVADHRDETWWLNGIETTVTFLGEPSSANGWSSEGPPEVGENEAVEWIGGAWVVLPDHRGEKWYDDLSTVTIDFLGDPAERGLTLLPVAPEPEEPGPPTNDDVNLERQRRIGAGCRVDVAGIDEPIPLQGYAQDQTNLLGLATGAQLRIAAGDTTTAITFRDADNIDHDLTPSQVLELWQGGAAFISAVMQASWTLKGMDPIPADYSDDSYWPTP